MVSGMTLSHVCVDTEEGGQSGSETGSSEESGSDGEREEGTGERHGRRKKGKTRMPDAY